tara:strand:+ start:212 stop:1171 length:960 start_codon:yes stop_codon:yes gene_type:complete
MTDRILVIGSSGQIGTELVIELRKIYGESNVVASDIRPSSKRIMESGPFEKLDVMKKNKVYEIIKKHEINQVYLLAALLSAKAEQNIELGWELNMRSHSHILDLGREKLIKKIFWPSSIAVFGPNSIKKNTPQYTIMDPNTVYGISKLSGERWNEYYYNKFDVDIRSLRYPGLIGWKSHAGGGTTDYAVDIFHEAIKKQSYTCFLNSETYLPMMYMPDAIRATIQIMDSKKENIKIRSSYNLAGISFSPKELAKEIQKYIPNFEVSYKEDYRQKIANSWPMSINDTDAQKDWKWQYKYNLENMVKDIIINLKAKYKITA